MGRHCFCNCDIYCLVWYEQMARKFCLQNRIELVDFWIGWFFCIGNCTAHSKLAKLESSDREPSKGAEVRVKI